MKYVLLIWIIYIINLISSQYVHKDLHTPYLYVKHRQTNINRNKHYPLFSFVDNPKISPVDIENIESDYTQYKDKQYSSEMQYQPSSMLFNTPVHGSPLFQLDGNIETVQRDKEVLPHIRDELEKAYYTDGNINRRRVKRSTKTKDGNLTQQDYLSSELKGGLAELRESLISALNSGFTYVNPPVSAVKYYNKELDTAVEAIQQVVDESVPQKKANGKDETYDNAERSRPKSKKKRPKRSAPIEEKDVPHNRTKRLIFADKADISEYPYVVSIQKHGEHWCTGALLNQRVVITTASCVWKSTTKSYMTVRACSTFTDVGGQKAHIAEVLKHPGWSMRSNPDNDTALLLLDRNIIFSHDCHAADLPNRFMMMNFADAWVTSWGTERRDGRFSGLHRSLQVVYVKRLDRKRCSNTLLRFGVPITNNFICFLQKGKRAPCTRDTGAPAVNEGVVWGLASWGIRRLCGTERFPAVFSYLGSYSNQNFIIAGIKRLMGDFRESPFLDHPDYTKYVVHPLARPSIQLSNLTVPFR